MKMTNIPLVVDQRNALWLEDRREWEVNMLPEESNDRLAELIRNGTYPRHAEIDGVYMHLVKTDVHPIYVWMEYVNKNMDMIMTVLMRTDI